VPAGIISSGLVVACGEGLIAIVGSVDPEEGTAMLLLLIMGPRRGALRENGRVAPEFVMLPDENFVVPELVGPSKARRSALRTASWWFGSVPALAEASCANKVWFHNPTQVSNESRSVFTVV
jgi:hypothetical protein